MSEEKVKGKGTIFLALALLYIGIIAFNAVGQPSGATIVSNTTDTGPTTSAPSRTDDGGTITFLNTSSVQQNSGWKAYIGNVSGRLTLDDSSSQTIYDWEISGSPTGEVYVTRDSAVSWGNVSCASDSTVTNEQNVVGGSVTDDDSINNTYNASRHPTMQVGTDSVSNSTCKTTHTYQGDAAQTDTESANFTTILLEEETPNELIYASFLEQDVAGYDGSTYDFQVIVPDTGNSTPTTYYFYLEIGS